MKDVGKAFAKLEDKKMKGQVKAFAEEEDKKKMQDEVNLGGFLDRMIPVKEDTIWRTQDEELDFVRDILGHPQPKSEEERKDDSRSRVRS